MSPGRPSAPAPLQRLSVLSARILPQGWGDLARQLLLFASAYYLYRIVRGVVDGQAAQAFANARTLIDIERATGSFFEPGLQAWAVDHEWLLTASNWMYVNSHTIITMGFLVWLYLARNHAFYFVRNMFMVAMGLALVLYVAFPTAPPRFMPEWGFTDSVAAFVGDQAEQTAGLLYNPYAAVPSMHVAFALMVAIPALALVRSRPARIAWTLYPAVVMFVVLATANHFWIDAALGALVAGFSAFPASYALGRARPGAWAWSRRRDEAGAVA